MRLKDFPDGMSFQQIVLARTLAPKLKAAGYTYMAMHPTINWDGGGTVILHIQAKRFPYLDMNRGALFRILNELKFYVYNSGDVAVPYKPVHYKTSLVYDDEPPSV